VQLTLFEHYFCRVSLVLNQNFNDMQTTFLKPKRRPVGKIIENRQEKDSNSSSSSSNSTRPRLSPNKRPKAVAPRRHVPYDVVQANWKRLLELRNLARKATDKAIESAAEADRDKKAAKEAKYAQKNAESAYHKSKGDEPAQPSFINETPEIVKELINRMRRTGLVEYPKFYLDGRGIDLGTLANEDDKIINITIGYYHMLIFQYDRKSDAFVSYESHLPVQWQRCTTPIYIWRKILEDVVAKREIELKRWRDERDQFKTEHDKKWQEIYKGWHKWREAEEAKEQKQQQQQEQYIQEQFRDECQKIMCHFEIRNKADWRKWALLNHPDKFPIDSDSAKAAHERFQTVYPCASKKVYCLA
jgi:hypothetical protein